MSLDAVYAAVGAVAAGELERAFDGLLAELGRFGVSGGELLASDGDELVRLAGRPASEDARRLALYDGPDAIGEIRLVGAAAVPVDVLELAQDVFGLGLGRRGRVLELELMRAAVAVNGAASLDEALDVLADACCRLTGAPSASVTVWDLKRGEWVVRAGAGIGLAVVGERIAAGDNASTRAATEHAPVLVPAAAQVGLGPKSAGAASKLGWILSVPFAVEGAPWITFQADWYERPSPTEINHVLRVIERLGALTTVAYRTEQERAQSEQDALLRGIVEAVPDGVWIQHGDAVTLNAAARRLLGHEDGAAPRAEEFAPRWLDGTPAPREEWPATICMRTGQPASARMLVLVNGRDRIFDLKAAPIAGGFVGVLSDVTEEHSEQVLTRNFLESLFSSLPAAAAVADAATGEILSVNRAFEELVGRTEAEIRGARRPYPWWTDDCDGWDRSGSRFERLFRRADGRLLAVEGRTFDVTTDDGTPHRRVALFLDLTERREFERQLVQSGKLAAIGELASGVAHEINNPLFAILGLVEFLVRDAEEGTKEHERLLLIQQTGLEIKEIVKALLDFARERTDELRPMLLDETVAEAIALVRRTNAAKGVEIVEDYTGGPTPVVGSPNQIKQIVLNLVANAQQAMPDGGTITVGVAAEGDLATFTVADTGPGIAPDVLPRVFEPFFTTKRDIGGTGLGLAVSHGIAGMHGGTLTAGSAPGEGATFRLALPLAGAAEAA